MIYAIKEWSDYESVESTRQRLLSWVRLPLRNETRVDWLFIEAFGDKGCEMFGAWISLVMVAATCPKRGVLADQFGSPLSFQQIALRAGFEQSLFVRLFEFATKHGLLVSVEIA